MIDKKVQGKGPVTVHKKVKRGPGRPKGSTNRSNRSKASHKGLLGRFIEDYVKAVVKATKPQLKDDVKVLVEKEVRKVLKKAFR